MSQQKKQKIDPADYLLFEIEKQLRDSNINKYLKTKI